MKIEIGKGIIKNEIDRGMRLAKVRSAAKGQVKRNGTTPKEWYFSISRSTLFRGEIKIEFQGGDRPADSKR